MERTLTVRSADGRKSISGVERDDWTGFGDGCPDCGADRYRRFTASGARVGTRDGTTALHSDYWGSDVLLLATCLDCGSVLHRHPAFELLYRDDA
jgi:predicted  nucleic acid-binding Zn-ribbon protein